MEGPQFSTLAESKIYRQWGVDIIGMTALPEAKLAREAEMHYVTLAAATDYDCWYEDHASVTVEMVINNLHKNTARAKEIISNVVKRIAELEREIQVNPTALQCGCATALQNSIVTERSLIPPTTVEKLGLIVEKYL
jgi:5'-methylthioadenosine phosphorylase